jgi:hypothetical protein
MTFVLILFYNVGCHQIDVAETDAGMMQIKVVRMMVNVMKTEHGYKYGFEIAMVLKH